MPLPDIPEFRSCITVPKLVHPLVLSGGHPIKISDSISYYSGGFCVVFPYQKQSKKYAVRCWYREVSDAKERSQQIAKALKESGLPYFVGFDYYEDGIMTTLGLQPIIVMDWVEAATLKDFIEEHIFDHDIVNEIAENFKRMVSELHQHHFSHGDLQHENILVKPDRNLILVDYDSMYVPALKGKSDVIKGLDGYQHLTRCNNKYLSEKADYFSELIIYISLKALAKMPELLKLNKADTLLFSPEDIQSKGSSNIFQCLKKDSDLKPLVEKLCDFMTKATIDDLLPLEDAVISLSDEIAGIWEEGNGYIPVTAEIDDANEIARLWGQGNGFDANEEEIKSRNKVVKSISEQFIKPE